MDNKRDEVAAALRGVCSEAALTALANTGEYKRACKDFERGGQTVEFADGAFRVETGGEIVTLGGEPASFRCTCPSPIVCRHILTAIMAVARDAPSETAGGLDYLDLDAAQIEALFGAKTYAAAAKRYGGSQIAVERSTDAVCSVNGESVVFLAGRDVASGICSCKKAMCEHKCLALLRLYAERTGAAVGGHSAALEAVDLRRIDEALAFLAAVLEKGVYACGREEAELLMFYSLNLSAASQSLGRNLRSLSLLLDEIVDNKMYVDEKKLVYHFCKTVNLLNVCRENPRDGDLLNRVLGEHKTVYVRTAQARFAVLGGYPFLADSGYVGYTTVLSDGMRVYGATSVLPTIYGETTGEKLYASVEKTARASPLTELGGRNVILRDFKTGANGNIILDERSSAEAAEAIDEEGWKRLAVFEADYKALRAPRTLDYFEAGAARGYALIPYTRMVCKFDESAGAVVAAFTHNGAALTARMYYNAVTAQAADELLKPAEGGGYALLSRTGDAYSLLALPGRAIYFKGGAA